MKIVIAPDGFKESLSAQQAAQAIERGLRRLLPEAALICLPVADGGDGTLAALLQANDGQRCFTRIPAPWPNEGTTLQASWGLLHGGSCAVIEAAAAVGLARVPADQRDPTRISSFGLGLLIRHALDAGVQRIIVGLGDSASHDLGVGMAQALGARFAGAHRPAAGGQLARIEEVSLVGLDARLQQVEIWGATDVAAPLSAAIGFAPQKGARPQQLPLLADGARRLVGLVPDGPDPEQPGMGAAGGLGYGLSAWLGASLRSGIEVVLEGLDFEARLAEADLVLTGEGRLDGQTLQGKACLGVARAAARCGVPCVALVGCLGSGAYAMLDAGLQAALALGCAPQRPGAEAVPEEGRFPHSAAKLEALAEQVLRIFLAGRRGRP